MDGFFLFRANGRELNRDPWLEQKEIPSTKPDHRGEQDELGY